jgi:hypothetical protein
LFILALYFLVPAISWCGDLGVIRGHVVIPKKLDTPSAPPEAKVYVYLIDLAKWDKNKQPWPPVGTVLDFPISSIKGPKLEFQFRDVPPGSYQVSAFIDSGRPHVRPGSKSFVSYPGDYTSLQDPEVTLKAGEEKEVAISYGAYMKVPDGYTSPKYLPEE